jgi:dynein light chain roadblock-type
VNSEAFPSLSRSPSVGLPYRQTLDHAPSSMTWEEPLSRLSTKAGVIATIVLERSSGLVLQRKSISNAASLFTAQKPSIASKDADQDLSASPTEVDEFSTMVWKFMNAAGSLVNGLDSEVCLNETGRHLRAKLTSEQDEVKLLRLRTKKHELVVVPDSKYILIVVHETTPS